MKKIVLTAVIAAAILIAAGGCGIIPSGQETAGIAYSDPQIDMAIYVGGGNWDYTKDDEIGQVYFYIPEDLGQNNVISISSVESKEDLESQLETIWDFFRQQVKDMSGTETGFTDITAGKYKGKELDFKMTEDNIGIDGKYLVWNTDERVYICSATAVENGKEQVNTAIDTILKNFQTYDDAQK